MTTNLISTTSLVQSPSIIVKIGNHEFGTHTNEKGKTVYPNYIESLEVTKINGQVNKYKLILNYQITEYNDPNYFEKVFSQVSISRSIEFTYGDCALPNFMFRNEKGMITKISSSFSIDSSKIRYTIDAISTGALAGSGTYSFAQRYNVKPSSVLYELLENNNKYGLLDLFPGMKNLTLCKQYHLIATNDIPVDLAPSTSTTLLDYIQYLITCMKTEPNTSETIKNNFFVMKFCDDTTDIFGGSYFQVVEVNSNIDHPEAYELDLGYPNGNCVFDFNVVNDENFAIYYEYQTNLHPKAYVKRLKPSGEFREVYDPVINKNQYNEVFEDDKSWWTKITQYPIKASLKIKGLLKPTLLMSYIRLNVLFYGRKHIHSGLYMVTKQVDTVNASGFTTTLDLVKISGDNSQTII